MCPNNNFFLKSIPITYMITLMINRYTILIIVTRDRIFKFLHILTDSMQLDEDKNVDNIYI